jgi:hypothetical protein
MANEILVLEMADRRLCAANIADRPELARTLASPGAVRALAHDGQAEHVVSLLSALDAERITEVLSAPAVVDELARHGQTDAVHRFLSVLSRAQQARVLSAPLAVVGLVRRQANAARVLLVIEALEPDQRVSVWAKPGVANAFLAPGFEQRVVAELERLSAAQLGKVLSLRVVIQLLRAGYVSRVVDWLSALSPAERIELLAQSWIMFELVSRGQRLSVIRWLSELEPSQRRYVFSRVNLRHLVHNAGHADLGPLAALLGSREARLVHDAQRELVGRSRIQRVLEFLERLPDPLPFAHDPFSLPYLTELAEMEALDTPSTADARTLWRVVAAGARLALQTARVIALVRRLSPQQQQQFLSPTAIIHGMVRGGAASQVLDVLESLPTDLRAAWLLKCRAFRVLLRDAPSRALALLCVLSSEEQLAVISSDCAQLPREADTRLFELMQTVSPARRNELLCETEVVSALTDGGHDAAVAEWLLALPQQQLARALAATFATGALLHAGRGKLVVALIGTLTVAQRVQVLSRSTLLSDLVDEGQAFGAFRLLTGLEPADQATVLEAPQCFYAFSSSEHLQLVAEWRERLVAGAPRALRISVSSA